MSDGVHPNDVTLLDALRSGNGDAAAFVKQRHNRTLWRIARSILRDDGEAEEAVQDTWLRAFTAAHAYRGEASSAPGSPASRINEASRRAERHRPTGFLFSLSPIFYLLPFYYLFSSTITPPSLFFFLFLFSYSPLLPYLYFPPTSYLLSSEFHISAWRLANFGAKLCLVDLRSRYLSRSSPRHVHIAAVKARSQVSCTVPRPRRHPARCFM